MKASGHPGQHRSQCHRHCRVGGLDNRHPGNVLIAPDRVVHVSYDSGFQGGGLFGRRKHVVSVIRALLHGSPDEFLEGMLKEQERLNATSPDLTGLSFGQKRCVKGRLRDAQKLKAIFEEARRAG